MKTLFFKVKKITFQKFSWFLDLARLHENIIKIMGNHTPVEQAEIFSAADELLNCEKDFYFQQIIKRQLATFTDRKITVGKKRTLEALAEQYDFDVYFTYAQIAPTVIIDTYSAYQILYNLAERIFDANQKEIDFAESPQILAEIDLAHPYGAHILDQIGRFIDQLGRRSNVNLNAKGKIISLYCDYPKFINIDYRFFILIKNNLPEVECRHSYFFINFTNEAMKYFIDLYEEEEFESLKAALSDYANLMKAFLQLNKKYGDQNAEFFEAYIDLLKLVHSYSKKYLSSILDLEDRIACYELLLKNLGAYIQLELEIMRDYFNSHLLDHLKILEKLKEFLFEKSE